MKATALNTTTPIWTYYTFHGFSENNTSYTSSLLRTEQNKDFGFKYNYDKNGNMTKLFVGTNTGGTDYTYSATETERYYYDALGQLTQVNYNDRNRKVVYTYDNAGNILSETVYDTSTTPNTVLTTNTYTYGDSSWGDLLTGYNNDTFTYDAIGNPLTYRDGITFTWNNGRQLQSYSKDNTTVTYTYDNSGLRLSKNVNGTHYTYLYHGGMLMQETVGTNILDYFYDASGNPLAVKYRTSANATGTYYYYARNSRGDVIGLYNAAGSLYRTYTYDVWGNILSVKDANGSDVTSQTDIANLQSLKYRGYYFDYESGLYYISSRYYDPVTHRFINADGQLNGDILGCNLFSYCSNNPVIRSDKTGEDWWHWALGAAIVVGCAIATVATCGGFAAAAVAVSSVACGVAASSTAATVAASAFVASAVTFTVCASNAAVTSKSLKEFNDKGNWNTVAAVATSAAVGVAYGYGLSSSQSSGYSTSNSSSTAGQGYKSFKALKVEIGSPGSGNEWHHIVEQCQIGKSGFSPEMIHNTSNIMSINSGVHRQISGYYSSIQPFTNGLTVRNWLAGQSFSAQYEFGIGVIDKFM